MDQPRWGMATWTVAQALGSCRISGAGRLPRRGGAASGRCGRPAFPWPRPGWRRPSSTCRRVARSCSSSPRTRPVGAYRDVRSGAVRGCFSCPWSAGTRPDASSTRRRTGDRATTAPGGRTGSAAGGHGSAAALPWLGCGLGAGPLSRHGTGRMVVGLGPRRCCACSPRRPSVGSALAAWPPPPGAESRPRRGGGTDDMALADPRDRGDHARHRRDLAAGRGHRRAPADPQHLSRAASGLARAAAAPAALVRAPGPHARPAARTGRRVWAAGALARQRCARRSSGWRDLPRPSRAPGRLRHTGPCLLRRARAVLPGLDRRRTELLRTVLLGRPQPLGPRWRGCRGNPPLGHAACRHRVLRQSRRLAGGPNRSQARAPFRRAPSAPVAPGPSGTWRGGRRSDASDPSGPGRGPRRRPARGLLDRPDAFRDREAAAWIPLPDLRSRRDLGRQRRRLGLACQPAATADGRLCLLDGVRRRAGGAGRRHAGPRLPRGPDRGHARAGPDRTLRAGCPGARPAGLFRIGHRQCRIRMP